MNTMPDAQLCHIGLYAFDLETMVDFYSRTFGLVVTDRGHSKRGFDIAFLSRDPIEHHQIAIASGRPKEAVHTTVNQISSSGLRPARSLVRYFRATASMFWRRWRSMMPTLRWP